MLVTTSHLPWGRPMGLTVLARACKKTFVSTQSNHFRVHQRRSVDRDHCPFHAIEVRVVLCRCSGRVATHCAAPRCTALSCKPPAAVAASRRCCRARPRGHCGVVLVRKVEQFGLVELRLRCSSACATRGPPSPPYRRDHLRRASFCCLQLL